MAKLKIFTYPDIILAQRANPIARVDSDIFRLADDMLETMYHCPGIGLAANQVGILQQIIVLDTEYEYEDWDPASPPSSDGEVMGLGLIRNKKPQIMVNPRIIYSEGTVVFEEGCLSVPDFHADVKRFEKIKIQFKDINNLTKLLSADGLLAVAIQHELDHLAGKLFIDRISNSKRDEVKKMLRAERQQRESGSLKDFVGKSKKKQKGF